VSKLQFDPDMIVQLAFAECLPLVRAWFLCFSPSL
jgi:hypothetical protein